MNDRHIRAEIIGFDSGWGCRNFGCEDGPHALAPDTLMQILRARGVETKWRGPLGLKFLGSHVKATTKEETLPMTVEALRRLCNHVQIAAGNGNIPVVIGGDHSSAIGMWSGVVSAADAYGNFGLVWVDAHLDAHTYETSYQGKWGGWWHGQPVTAITGHGLKEFRTVGGTRAKISPRHLSIIGPHSFEPAELEFVKRHDIRVYFLDEVKARGFPAVFAEALARATDGTAGFGLTLDLDAFHPSDAPGVGTAEDDGIMAGDVLPVIRTLAWHPLFRGMEIAEFNPHNDVQGKTRQLIEKLIGSAFTKPPLAVEE